MIEPWDETPIHELNSVLQTEALRMKNRVYSKKALAIFRKWSSLSILREEIIELDKKYASTSAILVHNESIFTSNIETYLTTSRAILDILSYCMCCSFGFTGYKQSFNDLRKKKCPTGLV